MTNLYLDEQLKIMHQAIVRFNLEGPNFKLDELAQDLKMSKKTLYKCFKNKEMLLLEVVKELFLQIKDKEQVVYQNTRFNSLEKLMGVLSVYPDYASFNYHKIPELKDQYPKIYAFVEVELEENWNQTLELLDLCIEEGHVVPISHEVFKIIFLGLYKQLLLTQHEAPDYLMRTCIETIFDGLKK